MTNLPYYLSVLDQYLTCNDCGCFVHKDKTISRFGKILCKRCESEKQKEYEEKIIKEYKEKELKRIKG